MTDLRSLQTLLPQTGGIVTMTDFDIVIETWPVAVATANTGSSAEMIANINTVDGRLPSTHQTWLKVALWGPPFPNDPGPGPYCNYASKFCLAVDNGRPLVDLYFDGITVSWKECDGASLVDGVARGIYPIPDEAITQPNYIQGGYPGSAPGMPIGDCHMSILNIQTRKLYELWSLYYRNGHWNAGSGAIFDLTLPRTHTRPIGYSSADASGLPCAPGHPFYDEIFGTGEIGHGFGCTLPVIRSQAFQPPFVWPASHTDGQGTHRECPPMGSRLRLKSFDAIKSIGGPDFRLLDPFKVKYLRAWQRYGGIVVDTEGPTADWIGLGGQYDIRWGALQPSGATLAQEWYLTFAGDTSFGMPPGYKLLVDYFDVLELGYGHP